jgi:hypothetical protein
MYNFTIVVHYGATTLFMTGKKSFIRIELVRIAF